MNITTVSFFGHREIYDRSIEDKLYKIICNLINQDEYIDFMVGRNGDFDRMASSSIRRAKHNVRDDNSSHILCLPYSTAEYRNNVKEFEAYYDEIIILGDNCHFKKAFDSRNKAMIDLSHLVLCYVIRPYGGAAKAIDYATKKNKYIINLATDLMEN